MRAMVVTRQGPPDISLGRHAISPTGIKPMLKVPISNSSKADGDLQEAHELASVLSVILNPSTTSRRSFRSDQKSI